MVVSNMLFLLNIEQQRLSIFRKNIFLKQIWLPSREQVHIPPAKKENHRLKSTAWEGNMLVPRRGYFFNLRQTGPHLLSPATQLGKGIDDFSAEKIGVVALKCQVLTYAHLLCTYMYIIHSVCLSMLMKDFL